MAEDAVDLSNFDEEALLLVAAPHLVPLEHLRLGNVLLENEAGHLRHPGGSLICPALVQVCPQLSGRRLQSGGGFGGSARDERDVDVHADVRLPRDGGEHAAGRWFRRRA